MKKTRFITLLLLAVVFSSCTTYQYTARQVGIDRRAIDTKDQLVGVQIDYDRQVTATSDYQLTRKDAIEEAEFRCLEQEHIDVIIDPVTKVEYNPFKFKTRYKATITGYAGTYKPEASLLDQSKEYTKEEIEKYKLLTDPEFPKFFYQPGQGDNYFFGEAGFANETPEAKPSLIVKPAVNKRQKGPKVNDYYKAIQLRNAGIGLMCGGVVSTLVIGLPCLFATYRSPYGGVEPNDAANITGAVFIGLGMGTFVASVPMIAVGAVRAKKASNMNVTLNAGSNGLGLALNF